MIIAGTEEYNHFPMPAFLYQQRFKCECQLPNL